MTLEPLLPLRTPERGDERKFRYGFQLRLPDGPAIDEHDPLLAALGAQIVTVEASPSHAEALQHKSLDPGSRLRAAAEPVDDDGDAVISLCDEEAIRFTGALPWRAGERPAALLAQGVEFELLVLSEWRSAADDRRVALEVLIALPVAVTVASDPDIAFQRPEHRRRRRVVLFADRGGDVRWWDAAAESGPADIGELPISQELHRKLRKLRKGYAKLEREVESPCGGYGTLSSSWTREALDGQAIRLWRRARRELSREFEVGFLGPEMDSPAWSPKELKNAGPVSNGDDDIPF
jgi:hypothetical protein